MLSLRYKIEDNPGRMVVECTPGYRTIFDNIGNRVRIPLPYVVLVLGFRKFPSGYWYGGIREDNAGGLRVYFRHSPINSIEDMLYHCPLTTHPHYESSWENDLVCVEHSLDYAIFPTLAELGGTIIDSFWSSYSKYDSANYGKGVYDIWSYNRWSQASIEDVLKPHMWPELVPVRKYVKKQEDLLPVGTPVALKSILHDIKKIRVLEKRDSNGVILPRYEPRRPGLRYR